ncbi:MULTISPECIES: hypothetical protein [Methylobacteriaceae]|uniref:Uncharacterized protein n=1 Tax=Methylorubrum thiocyanatum TaxID=47958 RepID=A0AA40VDT8_9HYPH|nr:hypothetical protein [Methylorubrum thiocyanatum]MBA8914957.1 hypothetical protein [Methylorubrum thiocyanatum]GJE79364.1 hypothetical protein CJNNKLLH_0690 [Methylorubrum thiocyanatum]
MSMTPRDMVVLAGRALTGTEDWAKPLARALGAHHPNGPRESIDPRSVSRWRTGVMEVLPWALEALPLILRERAGVLDEEIARLEERADEMSEAAIEIERELEELQEPPEPPEPRP